MWIFGLVERRTNQVILYPVADRREVTLIPVIQRHVEPGSTIYSDGWSAYCNLNDLGYRHFTVIHKYAFKKVYRNVETGQLVSVHTNKIEGAWTHAKMHFRKMAGTQITQFEGYLAEIMWRSQAKGIIYSEFFELLKKSTSRQNQEVSLYTGKTSRVPVQISSIRHMVERFSPRQCRAIYE